MKWRGMWRWFIQFITLMTPLCIEWRKMWWQIAINIMIIPRSSAPVAFPHRTQICHIKQSCLVMDIRWRYLHCLQPKSPLWQILCKSWKYYHSRHPPPLNSTITVFPHPWRKSCLDKSLVLHTSDSNYQANLAPIRAMTKQKLKQKSCLGHKKEWKHIPIHRCTALKSMFVLCVKLMENCHQQPEMVGPRGEFATGILQLNINCSKNPLLQLEWLSNLQVQQFCSLVKSLDAEAITAASTARERRCSTTILAY